MVKPLLHLLEINYISCGENMKEHETFFEAIVDV